MRTSTWIVPLVLFSSAHADTVVFKGGKQLKGVVVSQNDDQWVVINPWNSRIAEMTWEIPEKNRIARDKVEEVILADDPTIEYQRRSITPGLTSDDRVELARFAEANKIKGEAERQLILALSANPQHAGALEEFGESKWATHLTRNPQLSEEVQRLEREYIKLRDTATLKPAFTAIDRAGGERSVTFLERARRSDAIARGRRDKVPLTIGSKEAAGATYAIYVPSKYDPLTPTPLVVALHGGGAGGKDDTLVTGSGESAMNFYTDVADVWGFIVVCPTALRAPWAATENEPLLDSLLVEMKLLYNVDPRRIYLTGHSMGGFGTWHWGPARKDVWAACSPCAGGGGTRNSSVFASGELPVYIYHGADDNIVKPDNDRDMARILLGGKKKGKGDVVYTELDGVGHGFPSSVRHDIFRWFAGRRRSDRKLGDSSFDDKVERSEISAFGDPSELPDSDDGGPSLSNLIDRLMRGGGAGQEAVGQIAALKSKEAVDAVAKVLRSKKSNPDVRTLATQALGELGLPDGIKAVSRVIDDEDYRVIDAAVDALGKIGTEEAVAPLAKATAELGRRFVESFSSNAIAHTEYEVRLASFERLASAIATTQNADTFIPLIEKEIVRPVFLPNPMYRVYGDEDERFKNASPTARYRLTRALSASFTTLADPRGAELLEKIRDAWSSESRLVSEAEKGIEALR